jgi:hypothetical protein
MISKTDIENLINRLDSLYNTCADPNIELYYSKFAFLEMCGWLEATLDDIVKQFCIKNVSNPININYAENIIIGKVYGFTYDDHLRPMLMKSLGIWLVEQIETKINLNGDLDQLKSELLSLWQIRKRAAHTSVIGVTITFDSPSITKRRLNIIFPVLVKLEKEIM